MSKKQPGRPRNNISKLPWLGRKRIAYLLDDGKTYNQIQNDDGIRDIMQAANITALHSTSFIAFRGSVEYRKIISEKHDDSQRMENQLLEMFNHLSKDEKIRCIAMIAANFIHENQEEMKK